MIDLVHNNYIFHSQIQLYNSSSSEEVFHSEEERLSFSYEQEEVLPQTMTDVIELVSQESEQQLKEYFPQYTEGVYETQNFPDVHHPNSKRNHSRQDNLKHVQKLIKHLLEILNQIYNSKLLCDRVFDLKKSTVKGKKKILKCYCQRCQELNSITEQRFSKLINLNTFSKLLGTHERIRDIVQKFVYNTNIQNLLSRDTNQQAVIKLLYDVIA